jgi:response regulator NasT
MHRDMPRPVVVFTHEDGQETIRDAVRAGVSAYIVDGLDPKRIKPIVDVARARFDDTQALRRELDEVSRKLTDRKLVDKAKGVLMKARGLDEDAAYHAMRKLAMERGQTMSRVARDIIDMARVLL